MKIGFIGAGQMASALAVGIARSDIDCELLASDPSEPALSSIRDSIQSAGVELQSCDDNRKLVAAADITFIAVKPQFVHSALQNVSPDTTEPKLFVSVVAGTTIETLSSLLKSTNIVRAMPNTPCLVGAGVTAVAASDSVSAADLKIAKSIFEQVGTVEELPEHLLDAVTGLSGSGPAYVYTFVEALIDAGVLAGLPRDISRSLVLETVNGSVAMLKQSGDHPAILRDRVTSPGGTTIHGLEKLEQLGFRDSVLAAVRAATERSIELAGD